ncbi:lysozyme [Allokutzneria sp. A3M-2-11 16]|uniref:lysozyme n=1 Tax=Allokutzneria sp. A3M-2-11 16 TaxID=2962043 RepID=UPI0020B81B3D|nr:lysozyme [Allokutzneria sp. A3M-2-11 16]MCP3804802.1 lysozyme [Allokutzneria sp. A3M-2-11 16]
MSSSWKSLIVTALVAVATAAVTTVPAAAQPSGAVSHPDQDYAGSTLAANEGHRVSPFGPDQAPAGIPGIDVSHHQGGINWGAVAREARWVYMKATEGTGFRDSAFNRNYTGSYNAGMIRGAYHFALPDRSNGITQARFFVANGGGWSPDGRTLPPMLDIEYNPYGATCYGKSHGQMVGWIREFHNEVHRLTGRFPTIYTTRDWWSRCTGNNGGFGATSPLFIACYCATPGVMPNGWGFHTFWQYTDRGRIGGISGNVDRDVFNGSEARLRALALGRG